MQVDRIVVEIILLLILWTFIEQKIIVTTKYAIVSKRLPEQLSGTRIVLLADLHNKTFGKNSKRLIAKIDALAPDFIVLAGDMINKKGSCYPSNAFTLLAQLANKYHTYYAYGNHEQRIEALQNKPLEEITEKEKTLYSTWVEYKERLQKENVIFLSNEHITFTKKGAVLRITGISIGPEYFARKQSIEMEKEYLPSLLGKRKEEYQILIAHNPIYFNAYENWGADLILSGHLHGGMVRLPKMGGIVSPQVNFFPKYDAGTFEKNGHHLIISRGLGSHSVMPRMFNPPELICIELVSKNSKE